MSALLFPNNLYVFACVLRLSLEQQENMKDNNMLASVLYSLREQDNVVDNEVEKKEKEEMEDSNTTEIACKDGASIVGNDEEKAVSIITVMPCKSKPMFILSLTVD